MTLPKPRSLNHASLTTLSPPNFLNHASLTTLPQPYSLNRAPSTPLPQPRFLNHSSTFLPRPHFLNHASYVLRGPTSSSSSHNRITEYATATTCSGSVLMKACSTTVQLLLKPSSRHWDHPQSDPDSHVCHRLQPQRH